MDAESITPSKTVILHNHADVTIILKYRESPNQENQDERRSRLSARDSQTWDDCEDFDESEEEDEEEYKDDEDGEDNEELPLRTIHFKTSRKRLVAASERACAILARGGLETNKIFPDGTQHWVFDPIFDTAAFETVLRIIHGQDMSSPQGMTLDKVAKVAIVADDLQCEQIVSYSAHSWTLGLRKPCKKALKASMTKRWCSDVMKWIFISYLFGYGNIFYDFTRQYIRGHRYPLMTGGVPIPPTLLDVMQEIRRKALGDMFQRVEDFRMSLTTGKNYDCTLACNQGMLGALTQGLHRLSWWPPSPDDDFDGVSIWSFNSAMGRMPNMPVFEDQAGAVNTIASAQWRNRSYHQQVIHLPEYVSMHKCELGNRLAECLNGVFVDMPGGLSLLDYSPNRKRGGGNGYGVI